MQPCAFPEDDTPKGREALLKFLLLSLAHFPLDVIHLVLSCLGPPVLASCKLFGGFCTCTGSMLFLGYTLLKSRNYPPSSQTNLDDGAPLNLVVVERPTLLLG